ncbi:LysR family transcriptional regulator [Luteibacter aegosomaticola]|uniref:LysR family transcriptional regulator n=1 Tax=Luteibacter aegosomaticola TaxID=2911538 RepID=UPI001FF94DB5|nr:LysR family transcriptional regulator [Luteibacter aegosomaticola]UPG92129.1 LysR family transcriptional regulator [Luteibacter aegosomaticola]
MDHLLAMRVFGRVVETGGFAKAADGLRLPKSTVTKLVQGLEAQLGVRLFERTTRRVTVTAEGAAYYERTRHWLAELDDFETTLAGGRSSPVGTLRIDTGGSVAAGLILPELPSFRERYPGIQLQVGVSDRTLDLIGEGIDCAIRSTGDNPNLVTRHIADFPWSTCASPAYLERRGVPQHPDDLVRDRHDVIGYFSARTGRRLALQFSDRPREIGDELIAPVEVNESNAHTAAAVAGLGIAQTFTFAAAPHIARGELVPLLTDWQPAPLAVYLVYPSERRHNARLRAFVEWITETLPRRVAQTATL